MLEKFKDKKLRSILAAKHFQRLIPDSDELPQSICIAIIFAMRYWLAHGIDIMEQDLNSRNQTYKRKRSLMLLHGFGTWVECGCDRSCSNSWNFVNSIGISRRDNQSDHKPVCKLETYIDTKNNDSLFGAIKFAVFPKPQETDQQYNQLRRHWSNQVCQFNYGD